MRPISANTAALNISSARRARSTRSNAPDVSSLRCRCANSCCCFQASKTSRSTPPLLRRQREHPRRRPRPNHPQELDDGRAAQIEAPRCEVCSEVAPVPHDVDIIFGSENIAPRSFMSRSGEKSSRKRFACAQPPPQPRPKHDCGSNPDFRTSQQFAPSVATRPPGVKVRTKCVSQGAARTRARDRVHFDISSNRTVAHAYITISRFFFDVFVFSRGKKGGGGGGPRSPARAHGGGGAAAATARARGAEGAQRGVGRGRGPPASLTWLVEREPAADPPSQSPPARAREALRARDGGGRDGLERRVPALKGPRAAGR